MICTKTLKRHFDLFLDQPPKPPKLEERKSVFVKADGKYLGHWGCVIVFKTGQRIISWDFVLRENYFNYCYSLGRLSEMGYDVLGLISDWHNSLVSAFRYLYPDKPHQRCLVHTQRFCQTYLTQHPETVAGIQLLELIKLLNKVTNHREKNVWLIWFERWEKRHLGFINQRSKASDGTHHWWYTHKNTRKVYRSLKTSLDHLFLYLGHPGLEKDTNGLEAEFAHLKQKLNTHKGLTRSRQRNFVLWYFYLKSQNKIT